MNTHTAPRRIHQIGIAASQALNAIFGGWADESLSSRAWRSQDRRGWSYAVWLIDAVFRLFGERDHCWQAYESERGRLQSPPDLRGLP